MRARNGPGIVQRRLTTVVIACLLAGLVPAVADAVTALPTLVPTADGTLDSAIQVRGTTLAYDAIDEGVGVADTTTYLQNRAGTDGRSFSLLTDMPADFGSMAGLTISIRARTVGASDDRTALYAQIVAADESTALSGEVLVAANPGPSGWATVAGVALPGVASGSKAGWDGARLRLRWAYTQVGSADSTQVRLTAVEVRGSYSASGGPPTDQTPPQLVDAVVDGSTVTLTYDEALDPASVPASAAYAVLVDASARSVSGVAVGGSSVTLTLAPAVVAGQVVTVSYAIPGGGRVQDVAGNAAAALSGGSVTNTTPGGAGGATLPSLVPTADGHRDTTIQVIGTTAAFDALNEGVGAADTTTYVQNVRRTNGSAFVDVADMPADFTAMSTLAITIRGRTTNVSNDQTRLFAQLFAADESSPMSAEVLVATNPGTSRWTTVADVPFSALASGSRTAWNGARLRLRWAYTQVGTADSTQLRVSVAELHGTYSAAPPPPPAPDTRAPVLVASSVNGSRLALTYDEALDPASTPAPGDYAVVVAGLPRSVTAVSISGSGVSLTLATPVVSGDAVTVSYAIPATAPVQDAAGNDAAGFSGQSVSNVTPPPGGAVTASGNEITDAVRAAGIQGDGRSADSSYGIWEAATNLDSNGGFENGIGGWSASGSTIAASTEQARFGSASGKVVVGAAGDAVSRTVTGLTASTTYSRSVWIYRTETAATITVALLNGAGTGTLATATAPATAGWSRVVVRAKTESGQTSLVTRITASVGGVTWFVDGAQLERNVVATPYVETNGAPATRGPSKVSVAGTPVGPTQGWVAVRVRFGWDSTTAFSPDPGIVDMSVSNNDALFGYFDVATDTFHLERHKGGSGTTAASAAQSFTAGTIKTVIYAWTATDVRISVDGGAFVTAANTTIPGQATLYIGSDQVQGNGSNRQGDADYLWVAGGSGTLSNADAATIDGFGNVDHAAADFPGAATFAWGAD